MVKKAASNLMAVMMLFSLAACGQTAANESDEANSASNESVQTNIEDDTETQDEPLESESTEESAETGDLLEIEPLNPYPADYEECGEVALIERDENARPEIANLPDSIEEYDTIFIGYPIWLAYYKLIQCTLEGIWVQI